MAEQKVKSNSVITVTQLDGKLVFTVLNAGTLTFDPDAASAENRARAMMHGFKQRISDGAAIPRDTDTGASATPQEKMEAMQRLASHYESGATEWAIRVAASVDGETIGQWVARAMVHLGKARDLDHAKARIQAYADKSHGGQMGPARKKLAEAGDIAQAILELKSAAVKTDISSDDLLGEMDD